MTGSDFDSVRAVFLAARDLSGDARRLLLDERCAGDPTLRDEVESLLAAHETVDSRLDATFGDVWSDAAGARDTPDQDALPRVFGGYELLEVIGRGGMGTVYRARQRTPDRVVALKVIRTGTMTPRTLDRFRREANVLAKLQHPGIAQIFEAGSIDGEGEDDARPYFAMELIEGRSIDQHVARHELDIAARLALIIEVCDAVHHAHDKGVVHRDLKPENILIDAAGRPKVVDFGIARSSEPHTRDTLMRTRGGQLLGTLPYMSPEQVSGDPEAIDRRSDVYALGVITHELLSGALPYDIGEQSLPAAMRTIQDAAPIRLGAIDTAFRGDVETIVGKALEKEPSRRYGSALALAEDLRRYLAHEPIIARRPSAVYQLRLLARRHRAVAVGAGIALCTILVVAPIIVGVALSAQEAEAEKTRQQRITDRTNAYIGRILALSDPHVTGTDRADPTTLDTLARELDADASELPEVEAEVRQSLGAAYLRSGRFPEAETQLTRSAELWRELDADSIEYAFTLSYLGTARFKTGDRASAESVLEEAIDRLEGKDEGVRAQICEDHAQHLVTAGRHADAAPFAKVYIDHTLATGEPVPMIRALRLSARVAGGLGSREDADTALSQARTLAETNLAPNHPLRMAVMLDAALIRRDLGDHESAAEASTRAFDHAELHLKPSTNDWFTAVRIHVDCIARLEHRDEVAEIVEHACRRLAAEGDGHPKRVRYLTERLAQFYESWGDDARAAAVRDKLEAP